MVRFKKIIAIMLSVSLCTTFIVGCSKKEDNKQEVEKDKLQIEKVEMPSTGIVSDGKGWELWDKDDHTTTDKRGAVGENAVVASGKYEASQAGLEIIKAGGNAVDAAVATGFALCVVEPNATGIAGGGCMVIRNQDGTSTYIDFRETAPSAANPYMWNLDSEGIDIDKANENGGKSVAVPAESIALA